MESFKGTLDKDIKFNLFGLTQDNLADATPEIEKIASARYYIKIHFITK